MTEDRSNVEFWGARGDGITDNLAAFNAAVAAAPSGGVITIPQGTFLLSNTWAIPKPISIKGFGSGFGATSIISPASNFPAGADLITITGGYSSIRDIYSNMQRRGGNWLTFIGPGGFNIVERNRVQGIALGYWAIELRALDLFGQAATAIDYNFFYDFDGGAIWGNGGGDSVNITRNVFQLVDSKSHILKWDGVVGAANLNVWANNGGGASKFIELNYAGQFKIIKNQFEALTTITNVASAMISVNGPAEGGSIKDNNLNGHGNATNAIYLDTVQDCYVENNTISLVENSLKTTVNSARITFLKGLTAGVLNDANSSVSTIFASGDSTLRGNLGIKINPTEALHVAGRILAENTVRSDRADRLAFYAPNGGFFVAGDVSNYVGGKLGIKIQAPAYELDVVGRIHSTLAMTSDRADHLAFYAPNGGIYAAGNDSNYFAAKVGIGTTTPAEKLEVSGNILASGNIIATNGFTSHVSVLAAPIAIAVGTTPFTWVNSVANTSLTNNLFVYVDSSTATTITTISKNGQQIGASLAGAMATVLLKPNESITLAYSGTAPTMRWEAW